jgi:hypothetical protein
MHWGQPCVSWAWTAFRSHQHCRFLDLVGQLQWALTAQEDSWLGSLLKKLTCLENLLRDAGTLCALNSTSQLARQRGA